MFLFVPSGSHTWDTVIGTLRLGPRPWEGGSDVALAFPISPYRQLSRNAPLSHPLNREHTTQKLPADTYKVHGSKLPPLPYLPLLVLLPLCDGFKVKAMDLKLLLHTN